MVQKPSFDKEDLDMVHTEPTNEQLERLATFFREKIVETEIQRKGA